MAAFPPAGLAMFVGPVRILAFQIIRDYPTWSAEQREVAIRVAGQLKKARLWFA